MRRTPVMILTRLKLERRRALLAGRRRHIEATRRVAAVRGLNFGIYLAAFPFRYLFGSFDEPNERSNSISKSIKANANSNKANAHKVTNERSNDLERSLVMLALQLAPRSIDDFEGDATAPVADLFASWAADLPTPKKDVVLKAGTIFVNELGKTRAKLLFKLYHTEAEEVLQKAGCPAKDAEAWRRTLEDIVGFEFKQHNVPASAAIIDHEAKKRQKVSGGARSGEKRKRRALTLSDKFAAEGVLEDQAIADECFAVITTPNYETVAIDEPELGKFTDMVMQQYGQDQGRWNLGMPLCRILAKSARGIKLPDRGKVKGCDRNLAQMLYDKSNNRFYVRDTFTQLTHTTHGAPARCSDADPCVRLRRRST